MKTKLHLLLIFAFIICSCKNEYKKSVVEIENKKTEIPTYKLKADGESIKVESFDSKVIDENKFNHNNKIFKVGTEFVYSYEHITNENEICYFKNTNNKQGWNFVKQNSINSSTIKRIKILVADGNPMSKHNPDYNQTNLKYSFDDEIMFSMSGVIENEANLWMHPPRSSYFKILELNPFPYIKAPYEIGNKWKWNLKIGDSWADKRWRKWEGSIENKCKYEIINKTKLETELGVLECYVIKSNAKSRIGHTELTAFFNEKFGFVKLNYTNIDGTKTNLELIETNRYL